MKLSDVCIRRPVFATMMIGALLVLGAFSYTQLSVDLFPEIDFPFVVIQTMYPGASAETVETEVTEKIEEVVNQVSGVRSIFSRSQEGYSLTVIEFELEVDGTEASQDVREKVAGVRIDLPEDIEEPIVGQYDPSAQPVMSLAISGKRPAREITQLIKDKVKPRLEPVSGVGQVEIIGGSEREINIALDPEKMESHQVTVDDVRYSLMAANLEIPGGRIDERSREYLIRLLGKVSEVSEFDSVIVKNENGTPIYLSDVAVVKDTIAEQRSLTRFNGHPAVGINIVKQSGANVVEMAEHARQILAELQEELPPDIEIRTVNDNSVWIEDSIEEILFNIRIGTIRAVVVIFLFLLNYRPTIITGLSIPISIIATFTLMRFLGFTINFMTLLGLSLAVGILVDDAIVVIENIYRHIDQGETPLEAASHGTSEIGLAVLAASTSIMVVFLPVAFMEGLVGRFFYQFGMTVAFAIATSLFVAFTLTPMLASKMFRSRDERKASEASPSAAGRIWLAVRYRLNYWNVAFDWFKPHYRSFLAWSLHHRILVMAVAAVTFAFSLWVATLVGQEFMPEADQGKMAVDISTPPGTALEATAERFADVERIIGEFAEVEDLYTTIGGQGRSVSEGRIMALLTDASERTLSAKELMDSLRTLLTVVPGMKFSIGVGEGEGGGEKPIEVSIRGDDLDELTRIVHKVQSIVRKVPGCTDIDNTLQEGKPEIHLEVDRKLADDLGLNLNGISMTIRHLVEGDVVTRYKEAGEEYDVRVQLDDRFRGSADDIGRLLIASGKEIPGTDVLLVPVNRVARVSKQAAVGEYLRYNRQREVRVNANVLTGFFAGTAAQEILDSAATLQLPSGYVISPVGTQEMMEESFANILSALILSIIFIYLVLASQYDSFFDPLAIMMSLPLSLVGAILGLLVFGSSLSIISFIGIVMLMGLVTKNAILLIDFVKQRREKGVPRTEAILDAGPIRLRPILMTSLATVFGMLPLALGIGPGAEFRSGMARAVIGGMISSTALTLIVVPVVYTLIDDFIGLFRRGKKKAQPAR